MRRQQWLIAGIVLLAGCGDGSAGAPRRVVAPAVGASHGTPPVARIGGTAAGAAAAGEAAAGAAAAARTGIPRADAGGPLAALPLPAPPVLPPAEIVVAVGRDGYRVDFHDGTIRRVARCGAAYDPAALGDLLMVRRRLARVDEALLVVVDPRLPKGAIVDVLEAARRAGYRRLALDTSPFDLRGRVVMVPPECGRAHPAARP